MILKKPHVEGEKIARLVKFIENIKRELNALGAEMQDLANEKARSIKETQWKNNLRYLEKHQKNLAELLEPLYIELRRIGYTRQDIVG